MLIGDATHRSDWVAWEIGAFYDAKKKLSGENTWKRIRGMTLKGSERAVIPDALMNGRSTQPLEWAPDVLDEWLDLDLDK